MTNSELVKSYLKNVAENEKLKAELGPATLEPPKRINKKKIEKHAKLHMTILNQTNEMRDRFIARELDVQSGF